MDRLSPPATLDADETRYGRATGKVITYTRPEGYDGTADDGSYTPDTYDGEFKKRQGSRKRSIRWAETSLSHMKKRLELWPRRNEKAA